MAIEILMMEVVFMRLHREQGPCWELVRAMSHSVEESGCVLCPENLIETKL